MRRLGYITLFLVMSSLSVDAGAFSIGVLRYRGGDWYSCIPSVRAFLEKVHKRFGMKVRFRDTGILPGSRGFYRTPFYILNGHGKVLFTIEEKKHLKRYLLNGGFLFVNDDYGMDRSFRSLIGSLFPKNRLVKLPVRHPLYTTWYRLPGGLPKIHKHSGKAPVGYGLYVNGRLVLYYAYEADVIDGWDPATVHGDSEKKRESAFRIGYNILYYGLTR